MAADVAIKVGGVEVKLIGVEVKVEDIAGCRDEMERVFFALVPESDFLFDNAQQSAARVILSAPHGGIDFFFD